jgi:hypothetical protein
MHPNQRAAMRQQQRVLDHDDNTDACAFFNLLTGPQPIDRVDALVPEHRERVFPPTETLSMFLAQALAADGSCRQAVDDAAVKRPIAGLEPCSTNPSAYCQARARLPLPMISTLARQTGEILAEGAASWRHWWGRRVCLVDGTTVTLADTRENQATYPQPNSQAAGLGFPICRVVALPCLGSGALLDAATGPCEGKGSDEQALPRSMLDTLERGDILIGDAYYATYFLLCELVCRGVDGLFEQHGARRRSTDFSTGERLGARDHLIVYTKPKKKPDWLSQEDYDQAPATLKVREFQAGGKIMVTTFLCPKEAPKAVLATLYRGRWNVELDIRNIKSTLGMEKLRCKTPEMAVKELHRLPAGLQSHPALDGTSRPVGGPDPAPAQLQAQGADLDCLAATQRQRAGWGFHPRAAGADRQAARGSAPRTGGAAGVETAPEEVPAAYQTETGRERGGPEKRPPQKAALSGSNFSADSWR